MDTEKIRSLLNSAHSQIFHVWFIKRDGTLRHMACQIPAVETHKSVNPNPQQAQGAQTRIERHPELFVVYDLEAKAIRSFDMTRLVKATISKRTYEFDVDLAKDVNPEAANQ